MHYLMQNQDNNTTNTKNIMKNSGNQRKKEMSLYGSIWPTSHKAFVIVRAVIMVIKGFLRKKGWFCQYKIENTLKYFLIVINDSLTIYFT